jgi:hypothetical protein
MSTNFTYKNNGAQVWLNGDNTSVNKNVLDANVYMLMASPFGPYLNTTEQASIPSKLYGRTTAIANKVITTWEDRMDQNKNLGTLLSGIKGSGKSMTSALIIDNAIKKGYSAIVIPFGLNIDIIKAMIEDIKSPCVILLDEFEKMYDLDAQNELLSLLDGTSNTKHLFLLTVNNINNMNTYMIDRPGRIFYNFKFNSLDESFIREYCQDSLSMNFNNEKTIDDIVTVASQVHEFNFDMLKAIVEEMNRYKTPLSSLLSDLNITFNSRNKAYKLKIISMPDGFDGYDFNHDFFHALNILKNAHILEFYNNETDDEKSLTLSPEDVVELSLKNLKQIITYQNNKGLHVIVEERESNKQENNFLF